MAIYLGLVVVILVVASVMVWLAGGESEERGGVLRFDTPDARAALREENE